MISGIVIRNELYMARRALLAGMVGMVALMALFAGLSGFIIESFTGETGVMLKQFMNNLPPALLQAFNFDIDSFGSFEGWMASEPYTFYTLILAMMATNGSAAIVAREIDQGTAEAVVSLPLSRRSLFLSKVVTHLITLTVIASTGIVAALLAGYVAVGISDPSKVVALLFAGYLTSLAFAGIGYALSPFLDGERTAASLGVTIVLGSFLINIVSTMSHQLAWIAHASLFSLFDVNEVVTASSSMLLSSTIAFVLLVAGVTVGAVLFERKDISA